MASNYPGSLDSFDTIASDKKTSDSVGGRTHRQMHNDLGDAIEAVQAELGVNPAGAYDTVALRLAAIDDRVLDGTISDVDIAADAAISLSKIDFTSAVDETAVLGAELATGTGWTLGTGWAGDFATGFVHTAGNTAALTWTPSFATGAKTYQVQWTVDSATTSELFTVTLGGSYAFVMYEGKTGTTYTYERAIKSTTDGDLVFTPGTTFDGTISDISVREVTGTYDAQLEYTDYAGDTVVEQRWGKAADENMFFGLGAGKYNVSGYHNVAVGANTMERNASGFRNVAVGHAALRYNINGTRNVALGWLALEANIDGHRNVAVGPYALIRNTSGYDNIAIGADSMSGNLTGYDNIALGQGSLGELQTGNGNIAIGLGAAILLNGSSQNIAIGRYALATAVNPASPCLAVGTAALRYATGVNNLAVGHSALGALTTGTVNTAVGISAAAAATTVNQITAVGYTAGRYFTGGRNTAIGHAAMYGVNGSSTGERNVAVGDNAGFAMTTGSRNTIIGPSAAGTLTEGSDNILIGFNTSTSSATSTNQLNIGNAFYGNLSTKSFAVGFVGPTARMHLPASTTSASSAPLKFQTGVLMTTPEVGAVEFDGTKLYVTITGGTRKEIAFV